MADSSNGGADGGDGARRGVAAPLRRRKPLADSTYANRDGVGQEAVDAALDAAGYDAADRASDVSDAPPPSLLLGEREPPDLPEPPPPPPPKSAKGKSRGRGGLVALTLVAVLAAAGTGGYMVWSSSQEQAVADALAAAANGARRAAQVYSAGRLEEARGVATQAIADANFAGRPDSVPLAETVLGRVEVDTGALEQGRARLQSVLDRFTLDSAPLSVALALEGLGKVAGDARDDAQAVDYLERAAQAYEVAGQPGAARSARMQAAEVGGRSGDPDLARATLARALEESRAAGDASAVARLLSSLAELADRTDAPDRVALLSDAADALAAAGRGAEAARLRLRLATLQEEAGDGAAALASLERVVADLDGVPGSATVARNAIGRAAELAQRLGQYDDERRLRAQAIATARESGESIALIELLATTARRDLSMGFFDDAQGRAREAAEAAEALGDNATAGKAWADTALAALRLGDTGLAEATFRRAETAVTAAEQPSLIAFMGVRRGILLANAEQYTEALASYQQAGLVFDRLNEQRNKGVALLNAADTLWRTDQTAPALDMLDQAEAIFRADNFLPGLDFALEQRSQIALAGGEVDQARTDLQLVLDAHRAAGRWFNAANLARQLAGLSAEMGDIPRAILYLEEAEGLFTRLGLHERADEAAEQAAALQP